MKIIYLHGFASSGDGPKSAALRAVFGNDSVISPDLPIDPVAVVLLLNKIIRENRNEPLILVGTSLGGFYANYISQRYDIPCVLVNPSVTPYETMQARIGTNTNYATGEDFEVKPEFISYWKTMAFDAIANYNGALVHLFVAKDDDVIDPNMALSMFNHTRNTITTDDGGHRFEKHWGTVVKYIADTFA